MKLRSQEEYELAENRLNIKKSIKKKKKKRPTFSPPEMKLSDARARAQKYD